MLADAIIRWTARVFVGCYIGRILVDLAGRRDPRSQRFARWTWTIGCVFLFVHMAAAFHGVHDWSHGAAHDHVLKRTKELTGVATGAGLYVNYAFAALWLVDTIVWWGALNWSERRIPYWIVQAIFAFLMIQATVVFGPPVWIVVAILAGISMLALRWQTARKNRLTEETGSYPLPHPKSDA